MSNGTLFRESNICIDFGNNQHFLDIEFSQLGINGVLHVRELLVI